MSDFDAEGIAAGIGQAALNVATSLGLLPRVDPALGCNFTVEIDGLIVGGFAEVSGLDAEVILTKALVEGGQNLYQDQFVNGRNSSRLVLKRGLTTADTLWVWHQDVLAGKIKRRSGSIVLITGDLTELWRWNFTGAYPVKWTGPALKADSSTVSFESIELIHRGISKDMGAASSATASASISAVGSLP